MRCGRPSDRWHMLRRPAIHVCAYVRLAHAAGRKWSAVQITQGDTGGEELAVRNRALSGMMKRKACRAFRFQAMENRLQRVFPENSDETPDPDDRRFRRPRLPLRGSFPQRDLWLDKQTEPYEKRCPQSCCYCFGGAGR